MFNFLYFYLVRTHCVPMRCDLVVEKGKEKDALWKTIPIFVEGAILHDTAFLSCNIKEGLIRKATSCHQSCTL